MPEPDDDLDADLIAYLDGELDGPEAAAVEERLARDPAARAKAEAYKKTYDLLDYLPKPDPSPDFATRTVTRLSPVAASASSTPAAVQTPSGWNLGWASWLVAGVLAAAGGYVAHAALRPLVDPPPRDPEALAYEDVRVVESLPLYLGVDDLAFLRQLDESDLFEADPLAPAPDAARPAPPPTDREKLTALFRSYPLARQQQLREFDEQFRALPAAEHARLGRVLEGYAVWLDRLPDPERKDVLAAPGAAARLEAVERAHERAWRDGLPAHHKALLKNAAADDQQQLRLIETWKAADRARRDEWRLARRQWDVLRDRDRKPWPFSDAALARQVDDYVRTVLKADLTARYPKAADLPNSCRLTWDEFQDLRVRHEAATREGQWGWVLYGALVHHLAARHPTLPEPDQPVTDGAQLRAQYPELARALFPKGLAPLLERRETRGKWPEFALAVAKAVRDARLPVPESLGPCRPGKFGPLDAFLTTDLFPKLSESEKAGLKKLEGQWPEYPQRLLKLAEQHDLSVPGVTLPGKPSEWAARYLPPPKRD
jgi:hypothetical protein